MIVYVSFFAKEGTLKGLEIGGNNIFYPNDVRAHAAPATSDWDTQVSELLDRST